MALPPKGHPVVATFTCRSCGRVTEPDATTWRCSCGGAFWFTDVDVDPPAALARVTQGEGHTPIESLSVGGRTVLAKLEFESPTGSFKDRGAAYVIAAAVDAGADRVVADSSGNVAVAYATFAGRAGLECEVFVPSSVALSKIGAMSEAGAIVRHIKGSREDVAVAAIARVEETGAFYASHVWNPWFFEGTKHYALEVVAQLGRAPSAFVLPVGNGTLVLGAARAQQESGTRVPFIAVQAELCAPIAGAFAAGGEHVEPVVDGGTSARGIAIAAPPRGDEVLRAVKDSGGHFVTVTEEEIAAAVAELARLGFDVEPTAAAPLAALAHIDGDDVVLPIASGHRR